MTVIRLHPCAATVICGPCLPCPEYTDLSRTSPSARVVYAKHADATAMVSGAVTYTNGGSPVVVGMTVVSSANKLCMGRNQSVNGPLVYVSGIPVTATITDVVFSYYDVDLDIISTGGTSVSSCTNYLSQIIRNTGSLDCDAAPTVVAIASTCNPCTEATGTTSSASGMLTQFTITRDLICLFGSNSCVSTATTASAMHVNLTLRPPSFTPASGSRPCNWTGLAFAVTLTSAYTYSGTNTPSGGIVSCVITYTKNAGDNQLYITSASPNATGSGCVAGYDQLVRTNYTTAVSTAAEYPIPCTGYKLRQFHLAANSDQCIGGGRAIPWVNYVQVDLRPR